ncbi:unnamed protein product [Nezara viridula]|uniref:Uncharacterized protein n=1 Tax=Nezara viridula TaxID=85310 RepID=A0A9P0HAM4_NEZVI|nr:unnamed protein product [Nezara viridula]
MNSVTFNLSTGITQPSTQPNPKHQTPEVQAVLIGVDILFN